MGFIMKILVPKFLRNSMAIMLLLLIMILPSQASAALANVYAYLNMMSSEIGFINTETDQQLQTSLAVLSNWPDSMPWHVWISPDAKNVIVTTESDNRAPAALVFVKVKKLDWDKGKIKLVINKVLELAPPGSMSTFPLVSEVDLSQPITTWNLPGNTQLHGPASLPFTNYVYVTHWTDNRIRAVDYKKRSFADADPMAFPGLSDNSHGLNFNSSGTIGLGTGYTYDENEIDVYRADQVTGSLSHEGVIKLGTDTEYAAFTHFTVWLNNRYALTASMQFGPTSLTPPGASVIGPSVWLLDTYNFTASKIIDPTNDINGAGILRSASDLAVAGHKLYIAEEDSLDGSFGDDGFISVFDISDINNPKFIKRLKPGVELPNDFAVAHGITTTPDERYVYVASYASDYIIKIDSITDEVMKVYSQADGLNMAHGGYMAGMNR
jgi:DNA-binding beta-propeller fold protein YncE